MSLNERLGGIERLTSNARLAAQRLVMDLEDLEQKAKETGPSEDDFEDLVAAAEATLVFLEHDPTGPAMHIVTALKVALAKVKGEKWASKQPPLKESLDPDDGEDEDREEP